MKEEAVPASALRSSRYGIASFVISLAVGAIELLACLLFVLLFFPPFRDVFSTRIGTLSPLALIYIAGAVLCGGPLGLCVGVPLGIAGLFARNTNKRLAILGLTINILAVVPLGVALVVLGPAMVEY